MRAGTYSGKRKGSKVPVSKMLLVSFHPLFAGRCSGHGLWSILCRGGRGAAVVSCLVDENDASSESLPTRQAQMGRIESRQHHQESVSKPNYGLFPVSRKGHSKPWKPN